MKRISLATLCLSIAALFAFSGCGREKASESIKEVKKYSDNTLALMDLAVGRIDAVVVDEVMGRYYAAKKTTSMKS